MPVPTALPEQLKRLAEVSAAEDIRYLLRENREAVREAALAVLRSDPESPGGQFLIRLLSDEDLLLGMLSDPSAFSRTEAIAVARAASIAVPLLDIRLARKLPDLQDAWIQRLLAVLSAISDGKRIVFVLSQFLRHPNPHIRSKAALLIGRTIQKPEWLENQLLKENPRERANSVEALWGVDSAEARAILGKAANDPYPRVAANATLGLYRLGEPGAIAHLLKMFSKPEPEFRASAAWAMGCTGDPRFLSILTRGSTSRHDILGRNIVRAVDRIKLAASRTLECGRLEVRLTRGEILSDGTRRLRLAVAAKDVWEPLRLTQTQFIVEENSRPASDYRVEIEHRNEPAVLGLVLCGGVDVTDQDLDSARTAVQACLERKHGAETWAVVGHLDDAVRFTADKMALKKALKGGAEPATPSSGDKDVLSRLMERAAGVRGSRNLIVLAGTKGLPAGAFPLGAPDLDRILQAALDTKTVIHIVATGDFSPPHPVESLCRKTGGIFLPATAEYPIACRFQQIYASFLNRYEILYRPEQGAETTEAIEIRVEIYCGYGYGQDSIRIES